MKVLFCYTNINGWYEDSYSFGLAHIMGVTRAAGHEIKLVSILNKKGYQEVTDTFKEFKPEVVGFTTVSSQWSFAVELATLLKEINPICILFISFRFQKSSENGLYYETQR